MHSSLDRSVSDDDNENEQNSTLEGVQLEASSNGKIKGSNAVSYFKAGAQWPALLGLLFLFVATQILASAADIWVSIW